MSITSPASGTLFTSDTFREWVDSVSNHINTQELRILPTVQKNNGFFPVKLELTGGAAGDATTACSFQYTVKTIWDAPLGNYMTPQWRPQNLGRLVSGDGLIGQGYYNASGDFVLYMAAETIDAAACP